MQRLIKAEFLKLSKSLSYKTLLLCMAGMGILVGFMFTFVDMGIEINGRSMYLQTLSDIQMQAILSSIFAAAFICNEFTDRTFGVSIMSGCPRLSLLFSKAVVYIVGLLSIIFVYPIVGTVITTVIAGFGETNPAVWRHLGLTTFLFAMGIIAMGSFCFMLAMLIKNSGGTIGAGIGLLLALTLAGQLAPFAIMKFNFTYQLAQISQPDSLALYLVVILATIVLTLTVSKIFFEKAELK
jgi:ABC-type transport system involved in multi-copper enzyme maturation permease subunit